MKYAYEAVESIPRQLREGVVYHNQDFELAELLCACGCGHRIILLVPDGHQISSDDNIPTITPSILVADAPCRSHYFITNGDVEWLPAFSSSEAESVMRLQIARHVAADRASRSRWERFRRTVLKTWARMRAVVRL
jgi:hypothetical protein